jgi:hypothetical protein
MTITAILERSEASQQFSDAELLKAFEATRKHFGGLDFTLTLFALHLEICDRVAELETRLGAVEEKIR